MPEPKPNRFVVMYTPVLPARPMPFTSLSWNSVPTGTNDPVAASPTAQLLMTLRFTVGWMYGTNVHTP